MKLRVCLSVIYITIASTLVGQELSRCWSKQILNEDKSELIHNLAQSMNGNLLAVGTTYTPKAEQNGLLLILHSGTGELLHRVELGDQNKKNDIFYDIAQTGDGGFYVVGTSTNKEDEEARIWRLDENGVLLESAALGVGVIHHVVLLEDNDNSVILFVKEHPAAGKVKLIKYNRGKVQKSVTIGQGQYDDIVGAGLSYDHHILVCGNTGKYGNSQKGDIWVAKLNNNLDLIVEKTIGDKGYDKVWYAATTFDGNFLLATQTEGVYEDAQIIEMDADLNIKLEETFSGSVGEYANGVIRTFEGHYVMLQNRIDQFFNEAILLRGLKAFATIKLPENDTPFEVKNMYYGFGNKYLVGGIVRQGKQLFNIRVECLENGGLLVGTGRKSISSPKIQIMDSPRLEDENGDGLLAPNERAAVVFKIKNVSDAPLTNAKIKLLPKNLTGVNYFEEVYLPYLQDGAEKKISIPFNGQAALKGETLTATLQFFEGNIKFEEINIAFKTSAASGKDTKYEIIVDWGEDRFRGSSKEIRSTESVIDVSIQTYSNRPIVEKDTKAYLNGTILEDQKALKQLEDTVKLKDDIYRSKIKIQVPLKEGRNVIFVKVEKDNISGSSDSLVIYFEPRLPNLHVLAIGVPHQDLKYTTNDAQEFAALMRKQAGLGIYNEVFVHELITPENTTNQKIKVNFETLYARYVKMDERDKIESKDVLVVFISSHGKILDGNFVIIPSDYSVEAEKSTTVNYKQDIIGFLDKIKCKKLILIDACHSGAASSKSFANPNASIALNALNAASAGLISISSCSNQELSFEDKAWENGAFTEALQEALNNQLVTLFDGTTLQCDQEEKAMIGVLSIEEIFNFLQKRVPDLVRQKFGLTYPQTPTMPDVKDIDKSLNIFMLPNKSN